MTLYRNSKIDTYYAAGLVGGQPCEVRIGDRSIAASYKGDNGPVVYEGQEEPPGHFNIHAKNVNGKATLHGFPDDGFLEGWWLEGGYEGMWRIELEE